MRIAIDCRSVFTGCGGIGRYASALAGSLSEIDRKNDYLLLFTNLDGADVVTTSPRVKKARFDCGMIDETFDQILLPVELGGEKVDLYHGTCFSIPVAKSVNRRVATVHDVVFKRHPELVDPRLAGFLDRATEFSVLAADAVITVSEFSKREMVELYGARPEKVHVIPNGVERRFFKSVPENRKEAVRRRFGLPERFVLYVGSLEEKKNTPRLLGAWSIVRKKLPEGDRVLVLVGGPGGKKYDPTADVQRLGVGSSVRLIGRVDEDDLHALYASAECFVYPSLYEGFGLPVLEAMASGAPTVVSNSSSLPEISGDAAVLVDPMSAEAIADGVVKLLTDEELRTQLSKWGRARARRFSWEDCARATLDIYQQLEQ